MRVLSIDSLGTTWSRIRPFLLSAFTALSIASAHYMGFLSQIPDSFLPVVTKPLAPAFFAAFVGYFIFCAITARVLAVLAVAAYGLVAILFARLSTRRRRHFVRRYIVSLRYEVPMTYFAQAIFFALSFITMYLDWRSLRHWGILILCAAVVLLLAFLARTSLLLSPAILLRRLEDRRRGSYRVAVTAATFASVVSALFVASYYAGSMRHSALWTRNDVEYFDSRFNGQLSVLLVSGDTTLAIEHSGLAHRYVYFTKEFAMAEVTAQKDFKFLPIGRGGGG